MKKSNLKKNLLLGASIIALSAITSPASFAQLVPCDAETLSSCLDYNGDVVPDSNCTGPNPGIGACSCTGGVGGDGGCCFIAGTKVTMADGSEKNIENVVEGDELIGFDNAIHTVLERRETTLRDRSLISINGGIYFATCDHTFKTKEGWASADPEMTQKNYADVVKDIGGLPTQMEEGTELCRQANHVTVDTLEFKHDDPDLVLYDLSVTGDHTYLANGFVVHNIAGSCPPEASPGPGKVLCGYFFNRGMLPWEIYKGDMEYSNHVDDATRRGYQFWAVPLVQHLNNHPNGIVEKVAKPFVISWATEMAYRTRYSKKGHWLGKLQLTFVKPVVRFLGKFVGETDCSHLSSEKSIGISINHSAALKRHALSLASIS